jgi:SET domain-containing protein
MLLVPTYVMYSPRHGFGLFANHFIAQGCKVWEWVDGFDLRLGAEVKLSKPAVAFIDKYAFRNRLYSAVPVGEQCLCGDDARFMNHDEEPNVVSKPDGVYAAVDIEKGQEIFCDYSLFDNESERKLR